MSIFVEKKHEIDNIRQQQLEILNNVVSICEKHDLAYFLEGGTLAGAIMHNGFGPYDDDIDISMPRKDFEKFITICQDELLPNNYLDYYTTNANFSLTFAKVKNTTINYPEKNRPSHIYSHVFIDIFPLDEIRYEKGIPVHIILSLNDIMKHIIFTRNSSKNKTKIKQLYMQLLKLIKTEHLFKIYYFLFTREQNSGFLTNHGGRRKKQRLQIIKKESYFPAQKIRFMERDYSSPAFPEYIILTFGTKYMKNYSNKQGLSHIDIERL
ncbi:LicD family protein [Listeria booriae]|uniref:LicD family protein n=1 Tax=Listeria booriae TaxID=1552123 RepID=A0A842CUW7_9LIST|nr:LicD family protein [Listeria booriae]MBC1226719.1 LicD family protein [Listeria booriae]MBC1316291.1 LicD family protein [Listeria booriae]MBC2004856.1 LicD family protein [Listeria booriae]MBC2164082.1 LicD family protein [Listeria booriae]